jgi:hypothetical protein
MLTAPGLNLLTAFLAAFVPPHYILYQHQP